MAITYGFYNSVDGDRKYDAIQMSSIFDGVIGDGVYETIGDALMVKPLSGNTVTVGTGRAWFDHTWTLNDAMYPIELSQPHAINQRYDMIVLQVNSDTRENSIFAVTGTPSANPEKPTLIKTATVHQYPLAYILRKPGTSEVAASDIQNAVGTSECPFVIGIVKVMDIDDFRRGSTVLRTSSTRTRQEISRTRSTIFRIRSTRSCMARPFWIRSTTVTVTRFRTISAITLTVVSSCEPTTLCKED